MRHRPRADGTNPPKLAISNLEQLNLECVENLRAAIGIIFDLVRGKKRGDCGPSSSQTGRVIYFWDPRDGEEGSSLNLISRVMGIRPLYPSQLRSASMRGQLPMEDEGMATERISRKGVGASPSKWSDLDL